jgi:hypothetical protein
MSKRPAITLPTKPEPPRTVLTEQRDSGKPLKPKDYIKATIYLPRKVHQELRSIAFHENRKMHALFMEGIDRVLAERGQKTSAELRE